jgi:hypothetical protein
VSLTTENTATLEYKPESRNQGDYWLCVACINGHHARHNPDVRCDCDLEETT